MKSPAPYYRKRFWGFGWGLGLSASALVLMHAGLGSFRGHANLLNVLPALGVSLARAATAFFLIALVWTWVSWVRAGRPRAPF